IIVHNDPRLLQALRRKCLQPLAGLPAGSQNALRETLRAWLLHGGDRRATAAALQVHPQTVRYRMGRLRELFGDDLDDPGHRLKLLLALAWESARPMAGLGDCAGRWPAGRKEKETSSGPLPELGAR